MALGPHWRVVGFFCFGISSPFDAFVDNFLIDRGLESLGFGMQCHEDVQQVWCFHLKTERMEALLLPG